MSKKNRNRRPDEFPMPGDSETPLIPAEEVADWVTPVIEVVEEVEEPVVSVVEPVPPPDVPVEVVLKVGGGVCPNCKCFFVNDSPGICVTCRNCSHTVTLI